MVQPAIPPPRRWHIVVSLAAVCYAFAAHDNSQLPIYYLGKVTVDEFEFSPDDSVFAFSFLDLPKTRVVRKVVRGTKIVLTESRQTVLELEGSAGLFCFSPDSGYVAFFDSQGLAVYDIKSRQFRLRLAGQHHSTFSRLSFSADGNYLVIGPDSHQLIGKRPVSIRAWDLRTGTEAKAWPRPVLCRGPGLSRDGSKWFSGGWPGPTPRVSQTEPVRYLGACYRNPNIVWAAFTRDSQRLLSVHRDGAVVLWQVNDAEHGGIKQLKLEACPGLENSRALALLNASDRLAFVDPDGRVRVRKLFAK